MPRGQFTHDSIGAAAPLPAEKKLGLVAHYSIGIGFASLLLLCHPGWAERPTLGPAMATGLGTTTLAPFALMQPAFGMGIAASKTPNPTVTRLRSIRAHAIYGLGLYISGQALARSSTTASEPATWALGGSAGNDEGHGTETRDGQDPALLGGRSACAPSGQAVGATRGYRLST